MLNKLYGKIIKKLPAAWDITLADFKIANWRVNDFRFGHFNLPLFKVLKNGMATHEALVKIASETKWPSEIERVEVQAGFLNFYLKISISMLAQSKQSSLKEHWMIEFVGPNTNKPLHLGHLRNAFLGESLSRLVACRGDKVTRTNIYNDRGASLAKAMIAEECWSNEVNQKQKGDHWVGDLYVLFDKKMKSDPALETEIQKVIMQWEAGDKKILAVWKKLRDAALNGQKETLAKIGIKFNKEYFESKLWDKGAAVILDGLKRGVFKKDEQGNIIADLEAQKLGQKVVLRANGTAVYATTDVFLAKLRQQEVHPNRMLYVVGGEQDLHFKQLFAILRLLGLDKKTVFEHKSYGIVTLPDGRMKSREGTVVDADDILSELNTLATKEITERHKNLKPAEIKMRAGKISLAAIRYYFLHVTPAHEVHFNPQESITFTGNTGPYLLYTYARAKSILRKKSASRFSSFKEQLNESEQKLVFLLMLFDTTIDSAVGKRDPSEVAQYLYELAATFNEFYHAHKVIGVGGDLEKMRLQLVSKTAQVLSDGLKLLGIETIEEM